MIFNLGIIKELQKIWVGHQIELVWGRYRQMARQNIFFQVVEVWPLLIPYYFLFGNY